MSKLTKKEIEEAIASSSEKLNDSKSYLNRSIYDWITSVKYHVPSLSIKDAFESFLKYNKIVNQPNNVSIASSVSSS